MEYGVHVVEELRRSLYEEPLKGGGVPGAATNRVWSPIPETIFAAVPEPGPPSPVGAGSADYRRHHVHHEPGPHTPAADQAADRSWTDLPTWAWSPAAGCGHPTETPSRWPSAATPPPWLA